METISERILAARERAKLSQEEVADAVQVSRNSVSAWERGASEPRGINLLRLANALGVRQGWLRNGEPPMSNEALKFVGADGLEVLEADTDPVTNPGRIPMAVLVQESLLAIDRACERRKLTLEAVRKARVVAALFTRSRLANQVPPEEWAIEEIMRPEK